VPVAATTAVASSRTTVAGTAVLDTTYRCPDPPKGYEDFTDYPPIVMSGDLQGCWYTNIDRAWDLGPPTGLYFEVGREVFVGSVKTKSGSISTVYSFESKWDPDVTTGKEVWGQCQHPIVPGSGTGALNNITGYLGFVDIVTTTPTSYKYSGFVNLT
jgi:hypothetical protein